MTNGNLVLELSVPPKLVLPRKGDPEMLKTRYTAMTCDPDEFEKKGFFLRQNEMKRTTELFIVITMYNVSVSPPPLQLFVREMGLTRGAGGRGAVLPDNDRCHAEHLTPLFAEEFADVGRGRLEESEYYTILVCAHSRSS